MSKNPDDEIQDVLTAGMIHMAGIPIVAIVLSVLVSPKFGGLSMFAIIIAMPITIPLYCRWRANRRNG